MSKKVDILFVAPLPPPLAGPEISADLFGKSNCKEYFDIRMLNYGWRNNNSSKGQVGFRMLIAFFVLKARLIKSLIKYRPKVVYYYVTATILGWICKDIWVILLSKLFGSKVVIHMRAGHFRSNYERSANISRFIIKRVLGKVDVGICQSKSLTKQFEKLIDQDKVKHISNMIDLNAYNNTQFKKYDNNLILFMGHLSHSKGYCDILSIMPNVIDKFPKAKFYFAGTKINKEKNVFYNEFNKDKIKFESPDDVFNKYIKNKYENNYEYLGNIDHKKKIEILKNANLFILPSYSEGFSMAILEAFVSAKPIITTKVGASTDIIKNNYNGILIEPGNKNELEDAILNLLSNKNDRDRIALNNFIERDKFSMQNIEKIYIDIFRKLV